MLATQVSVYGIRMKNTYASPIQPNASSGFRCWYRLIRMGRTTQHASTRTCAFHGVLCRSVLANARAATPSPEHVKLAAGRQADRTEPAGHGGDAGQRDHGP